MTDHTCERHAPGTAACAVRHHCPCPDCRRARRRQDKRRRVLRPDGATIDAAAVRARLHDLHAGASWSELAALLGCSPSTLIYQASRSRRINVDLAARIVALAPVAGEAGRVDATGTHRRIRALMALGWDGARIAERMGVTCGAVHRWLERSRVTTGTRSRVAAVYDQLWGQSPPMDWRATRCRNAAVRRGWALPLQWDDDDGPHGIDNPAATPHVTRQREIRKNNAAEILWLAQAGTPAADLAKRVGVTEEAVAKALKKAGRVDLWEAIRDRRDLFQDHTAAVRARLSRGRAA